MIGHVKSFRHMTYFLCELYKKEYDKLHVSLVLNSL